MILLLTEGAKRHKDGFPKSFVGKLQMEDQLLFPDESKEVLL